MVVVGFYDAILYMSLSYSDEDQTLRRHIFDPDAASYKCAAVFCVNFASRTEYLDIKPV